MRTLLTAPAALLLLVSSAHAQTVDCRGQDQTQCILQINCRETAPPQCLKPPTSGRCVGTLTQVSPGVYQCRWKVLSEREAWAATHPVNPKPSPPLREIVGLPYDQLMEVCIHERPYDCVTHKCSIHWGPKGECVWQRAQ
jgi:hypothetical protein